MDQGSFQTPAATGAHSGVSDHRGSRRMRSNSVRDQSGSEREDRQRSRRSSVSRSDVNSEASRYNRAQGPINAAVQSALKPADPNQSSLPPELISQLTSQITASVLQQLQASQHSPTAPQPAPGSISHTGAHSTGVSPPVDRGNLHTPPSPWRASEEAAQTGLPISPGKLPKSSSPPNVRRPPSPPFSHGAMSDDNDTKEAIPTRPELERTPTGGDLTIVETIWGKLFDEQGQVTTRLSQFLRGIAVHIIEDYEPKHSLVISPEKMQKYYEATRQSTEIYPWQVIFDDRTSSISRMFREVEVQHHLTQERPSERPDIPGLTPTGFETWMTLVLRAHPDEEFDRLAYTALHMPVSNPDDRRERFPKELSRRQFPKEADRVTASRLQKLMLTHCGVKVSHRSHTGLDSESRPTQTQSKPYEAASSSDHTSTSQHLPSTTDYNLSRASTRSDRPSVSEQDRSHLQPTVSDAVSEDGEERSIPAKPIERERKPYSATPSGGKNYNQADSSMQSDTKPSYSVPSNSNARLGRSSSLNGRPGEAKNRPAPISIHQKSGQQNIQPIDIPPPRRPRAGSVHQQRDGSRGDRNRSPSLSRSSDHPQRSDGDFNYGSYPSANSADYTSGSSRPERHEPRVSFSNDVKDREPRQRYQSVSAADDQRYYYSGDPYRSGNPNHTGSDAGYPAQQYPPNSYRSRA